MKTMLLIILMMSLVWNSGQAQTPTDTQWATFWEDFRTAANSGVPEKIWNYMLFPIPGNGVDQETFLADFSTYFPQSALIGIIDFDSNGLVLVDNYLNNINTNDNKLIKMRIERSGFISEYYFGRVEDTIYLLDIKQL